MDTEHHSKLHTKLLIAAACLLGLFATISASLPYPILPPLFAGGTSNGLNTFLDLPPKLLLGLALMINPLGLLIGSALQGPLSDRYGCRPVLLVTALGAALGHALTALALVFEAYGLFILARFATGLLGGNGSVVRAMLAERLDGALRVRAMAWLNSAFYLGWLGGPLLAALTIGFGLMVPFLIAGGALVLSAALVAAVVPRRGASSQTGRWWQVARDGHVLHLLRHQPLRMLFIVQLAYSCGVGAFYEFYPLWLVETAHFGTAGIAWTTAAMCALMTLTSLFAGRLSPLLPLQRAAWNASLVAAAVALVALGNSQIGIAAILLFGIPHACYSAIIPAWCAERFAVYGHGAVMGLLSTTFCLATILMALAGSVLTLIDTRLILLLGAALAAWAGWRLHGWRTQMAQPSTLAGSQL